MARRSLAGSAKHQMDGRGVVVLLAVRRGTFAFGCADKIDEAGWPAAAKAREDGRPGVAVPVQKARDAVGEQPGLRLAAGRRRVTGSMALEAAERPIGLAGWCPAVNRGQHYPYVPVPFVMSTADMVEEVDSRDAAMRAGCFKAQSDSGPLMRRDSGSSRSVAVSPGPERISLT